MTHRICSTGKHKTQAVNCGEAVVNNRQMFCSVSCIRSGCSLPCLLMGCVCLLGNYKHNSIQGVCLVLATLHSVINAFNCFLKSSVQTHCFRRNAIVSVLDCWPVVSLSKYVQISVPVEDVGRQNGHEDPHLITFQMAHQR